MSDLARLPSYPSPTTLIARSGIQFLDFGFDPVRLKVREWGFHDAAADKVVDDLVQLDFDEVRGQYEVVESRPPPRRRAQPRGHRQGRAGALSRQMGAGAVPAGAAEQPVPRRPGRLGARARGRSRGALRRGLPRRAGQPLPRRAGLRHRPDRRGRGPRLSRTVAQGRDVGRAVHARPPAARQSLAAAPGLDDPVAGGAVPRAPSARHARGDRRRHQAEAAGGDRALSRLPRPAGRRRALPADQAGGRRRAAGPRRHRGRPRARCRQLAHLRPSDRGGGRARRQPERLLRAGAARPLASGERAHQAVRIARRVRPGLVRQEPPVAAGRPRRCLRVADHDARRAGGDAAGRAPARHRGQHRHVEPQALSVGRGTADPRMALQRRLCPGPDGDAGRRRTDGAARQPEGRAAASGRARRRQRRPSAGVRAALFALLDHDLRAVRGPAAGADPDELAAAARPARPCRDAAPAAPHRAHPADRHAAGRAPDLPQARRGRARPGVDDDGLEARRSRRRRRRAC